MVDGFGVAIAAFLAGGILKGAIGAGTPIVAVPIMSIYHGVPFAVAVFALPGLLSNAWQAWRFRRHIMHRRFILLMVAGAMLGALAGTFLLAALPSRVLSLTVGGLALIYVVFRLTSPHWRLGRGIADALVLPVSLIAGILQGAVGISAPVSLTFLNALGLSRLEFIGTVSVLFMSMALVQVPALMAVGLMDRERFLISVVANVPLFLGMPIGNWMARHMDARTFQNVILVLLAVIAARLILGS
ncbi:sulfite exporter TauE/SafE family protein [uncultured Paracoccus sp.]|uniref:sulfite exporter TauE/SafE family protein n=1 Tax=uncultured Paracoccus sp. TaxID=189685 RepID=UPI002620925B|nr:sulfite exporter TauE/SafE family protein [uncultured Paracoccus sp.]